MRKYRKRIIGFGLGFKVGAEVGASGALLGKFLLFVYFPITSIIGQI